ncbi:hypothetical protein B0T19DRAFT_433759 [Cercophora scortea]|uniref:F-box domain-containing protein n=1 Tax=Cercophora scortea TaxID=314031 RepID=A0AAE0I7T0_9PEZI|nr:hypothetical protein B0T19DRAFT_433759 [Cercophora scortea]
MPSLNDCPDEIIRHILSYVSPEDNLASFQRLSRRFHHTGNESLLWKYYCRTSFKYWNPEHQIREKLAAPAATVAWRDLWFTRKRINVRVAEHLRGVLVSKVGQLRKLQQICRVGCDAKDYLLEQCHVDESAEDILARRYYATSALDSINRGIAVDVWARYQGNPLSARGLDRALGAFDMFVLHDQPQDLDYILHTLDVLTEEFQHEHPTLDDMTTRQKALSLVRWLRARNLTGMDNPDRGYRNLRNCLIGHALSEEPHSSLPIISSAIFCCIAERLGMTSQCAAFPSHVHASVFAPPGLTLDGAEEETPNAELEIMYLDPFGSDNEVTLVDLRSRLVEFGWTQGTDVFQQASPVPIIVGRTAQNIKAAHSRAQFLEDYDPIAIELKQLRAGHPDLNLEAANYGAMWAELLMRQPTSPHWDINLDSFLNRFALSWAEDAWIVERYLVPLYDQFIASQQIPRPRAGWENVREILGMLRNLDNRHPTVNRRYTEDIRRRVHFRIGQVFRHKRYEYVGIINGWAATGTSSLPAPHHVDETSEAETPINDPVLSPNLVNGRISHLRQAKTYYTCLRPTVDRLRVAQDNIEIITDASLIPDALMYLAGKFFKRFDKETCTFVSNITEYYPDD